ncbi:MAG: leucyl aminopeptidase [Ignavibacteriaceae bacterium]|nr:leucyl aminopeptidase [Ignavibacteriaceae bacterium]
MFKLEIKSGSKKIRYDKFSICIRYFLEDKKLKASLDNFERVSKTVLTELQRKNFFSKEISEIRVPRQTGKPDELLLAKITVDTKFTVDFFRNHLAGFIQSIEKEEIKSLHIFIPDYNLFKKHFDDQEYFYQTFIEGVCLGNYQFTSYKSDKIIPKNLEVYFYADNEKILKSAISTAQNIMSAVEFTKNLQNEPATVLTPDEMSKRIKKQMAKDGIRVKIFNEKNIEKMKMGGLSAVGIGSANPPRLIQIEYHGLRKNLNRKKTCKKHVALVGKGVTFDSGGISIKPYQDMWEMKADMSGAAVVAGAILAAARTKLKINITGILPVAENMLSGSSMKPGDIITTFSGKTIEVDNTDAEGRIILADALAYACEKKPDIVLDLATLTGACVVALGEFTAGIFTKDDELSRILLQLGNKTHEKTWQLPMWDIYHVLNKSEVADVKNVGGKWGGAITAAKFLENFVDPQIPWAHIDIAGPAMPNGNTNYSKKYMTGFGVRLIYEYIKKMSCSP